MSQPGIYKESVQDRWGEMPLERRRRLFWRFNRRLERLFDRLGLVCMCTNCERVLTYEQYLDAGRCPFCDRNNVVTPY